MKITKTVKKISKASVKVPIKVVKSSAKISIKAASPVRDLLSNGVKKIASIKKNNQKVIEEIQIFDFKKLLSYSAKKVVLNQEEINKINVFPVADKDTGYNLSATLLGTEGAIQEKSFKHSREFVKSVLEGATANAKGNVGMITVGFLSGFLNFFKSRERINSLLLAKAMKKGVNSAYKSIADPCEGTILDVIKISAEKALEVAKEEKNIIKVLEAACRAGEIALSETKGKLEVLKKNNVVDAGGLGFLKFLEGWLNGLKETEPTLEIDEKPVSFKKIVSETPEYRYCLQVGSKRGKRMEKTIKEKISPLGNSLEILKTEKELKFHIHTNSPEKIKKELRGLGDFSWQLEDMIKQVKSRPKKKKPLGLIVGESADLPKDFLERYQIEEIPFLVDFPEGEKIAGNNLFEKMRKARRLPTTSQPSFQEYLRCYQKALEKFEKVLVITLSCKLSGAYSQARIARSMLKNKNRLTVFDCFNAETAEGLIAIKAQEMILEGKSLKEILEELKRICPKLRLLGFIDDFKYLSRGGRFKLPLVLIKGISLVQKIGIRPLVGVKDGKVKFFGIKLKAKNMAKALAKEINNQRENKEIRVAICQADNLKGALQLKEELGKLPRANVLYVSLASPVVGVHAGPGTLIVSFYPVE